jgi:hypothetical protein
VTAIVHRPRRTWVALAAGALAIAGVVAAAQPAYADTTVALTGYQEDNFVVQYWNVARSNTNAKNLMYVKIPNTGGCGCGIAFASRPGLTAATNARTNGYIGSTNSWYQFHADNGNAWLSAGSFYLSSAVGGEYVNTFGTWSGSLMYNVKYI